jgi:hypothetical protein
MQARPHQGTQPALLAMLDDPKHRPQARQKLTCALSSSTFHPLNPKALRFIPERRILLSIGSGVSTPPQLSFIPPDLVLDSASRLFQVKCLWRSYTFFSDRS